MATATSKLTLDKEIKSEPHKFYKLLTYTLHHLCDIFPESFKTCELLEGDGESVGSVRLWSYVLPGTSEVLVCKEKMVVADDEKMMLVVENFEGDHTDHYHTLLVTVQVVPKDGEEGGLVKWSLEFGKCHDAASDPHHYMDMYAVLTDKVDAHLLAKA